MIGAITEAIGGAMTNKRSAEESARNRKFQRTMYKRRFQMQSKDARKAGINPIMLAGGGAPGPPGGSTAQFKNPMEGFTNTAFAAKKAKAELALSAQSLKESEAREAKTKAETVGTSVNNALASIGLNQAAQEAGFWASPDGREAQKRILGTEGMSHVTKPFAEGGFILDSVINKWSAKIEAQLRKAQSGKPITETRGRKGRPSSNRKPVKPIHKNRPRTTKVR